MPVLNSDILKTNTKVARFEKNLKKEASNAAKHYCQDYYFLDFVLVSGQTCRYLPKSPPSGLETELPSVTNINFQEFMEQFVKIILSDRNDRPTIASKDPNDTTRCEQVIDYIEIKNWYSCCENNQLLRGSTKVIYTKYSKQFKWNSYFYVSGQNRPFWAALKLL